MAHPVVLSPELAQEIAGDTTDIIGFKPKWERAFDRLTAFLMPANAPASTPKSEVHKLLDPFVMRHDVAYA